MSLQHPLAANPANSKMGLPTRKQNMQLNTPNRERSYLSIPVLGDDFDEEELTSNCQPEMTQTSSIFSFPSFSETGAAEFEMSGGLSESIQPSVWEQHTNDLCQDGPAYLEMYEEDDEEALTTVGPAGIIQSRRPRISSGGFGRPSTGRSRSRSDGAPYASTSPSSIQQSNGAFEADLHVAALTAYLMSLPIAELDYVPDHAAKEIISKSVQDHVAALTHALVEEGIQYKGEPEQCHDFEYQPVKRRSHSYSHPTKLETLYEDEEFSLAPPSASKRRNTAPSSCYSQPSFSSQPSIPNIAPRQLSSRPILPLTAFKPLPSLPNPEDMPSIDGTLAQAMRSPSPSRSFSGSTRSNSNSTLSSFDDSSSPTESDFDEWDSGSSFYSGCSTPEVFEEWEAGAKEAEARTMEMELQQRLNVPKIQVSPPPGETWAERKTYNRF